MLTTSSGKKLKLNCVKKRKKYKKYCENHVFVKETITFLRFYRAAYLRRGPRTIENVRLFANSKQNIYVWNLKLQDYREENFFVYIICLVTHSFIRIHFKTLRLVCVISSFYIRIPRREFSACTVTQWKIKMQTIQYRRTRIWEMKKDKYTKTLAKNQVCEIFQMRDIGKNGLPKFIKLCMETPCWCPFQEHQYGRRIPTETSVFEFSY